MTDWCPRARPGRSPREQAPRRHNAELSAHQPLTPLGRGDMTRNIHVKAKRASARDACLPCWGLSERPSVVWLSCASLCMWLCISPRSHLQQEHSSPTVLPPHLQAPLHVTDSRGLHALRWPPGCSQPVSEAHFLLWGVGSSSPAPKSLG